MKLGINNELLQKRKSSCCEGQEKNEGAETSREESGAGVWNGAKAWNGVEFELQWAGAGVWVEMGYSLNLGWTGMELGLESAGATTNARPRTIKAKMEENFLFLKPDDPKGNQNFNLSFPGRQLALYIALFLELQI